jgi:hypothetical protein
MDVVILNPNNRPYAFLLDFTSCDGLDTAVVILRLTWFTKGATKHRRIIGYQDIDLGLDDLDAFATALWDVLAGAEGTSAQVELATENIWQLSWKNDGIDLSLVADPAIYVIPPSLTLSIADALALNGDIAVARQAAQDYIESNHEAAASLMRFRDWIARANGRLPKPI